MALEEGAILARFDTTDTQLRAREVLMGVLGDKYVVALNLAPATPRWLAALNAEPMKLGLDLRVGGVEASKNCALFQSHRLSGNFFFL
ncbi:hypothetical protein [Enterobacter ludwigii]|uniref:hypothetical protein n=1 Tax=Enterobacter ludwigii TaxID=299767 RepID=UPI001E2F29AE